MATWEDGPEYAPAERPNGFVEPTVAPLDVAPPRHAPSAAAPLERPGDFSSESDRRPLATYLPSTGPQRNPEVPFEMARSTMTEVDSAWGLVHHYHVDAEGWAPMAPDPRAPIQVGGVAPPHAIDQFLPGHIPPQQLPAGQYPPPDQAQPVQPGWGPPQGYPGQAYQNQRGASFGAVFNAVTVPTFVTLLIGGLSMAVPFFGWLSPLMFIMGFATANRIAYRRNWVRNTFLVATGALATTAVAGFLLSSGDLLGWFDLVSAVSTALCWIVLVALMAIVYHALSNGDQPDHPDHRTPRGWT